MLHVKVTRQIGFNPLASNLVECSSREVPSAIPGDRALPDELVKIVPVTPLLF